MHEVRFEMTKWRLICNHPPTFPWRIMNVFLPVTKDMSELMESHG